MGRDHVKWLAQKTRHYQYYNVLQLSLVDLAHWNMKFLIDNLPVRIALHSFHSEESLSYTHAHFVQIIFPYDRIYPGGFPYDAVDLN